MGLPVQTKQPGIVFYIRGCRKQHNSLTLVASHDQRISGAAIDHSFDVSFCGKSRYRR
jgi:hypothetical protein